MLASSNPANFLEALRGVAMVTEEGKEKVRGTPTTRFNVTMDPEAAIKALKEDKREQARAAMKVLGTGSVKGKVWLDDDGLVRRYNWGVDISPDEKFRVEMSMEMFDYGEPVDIKIPPVDGVHTLSSFEELTTLCLSEPESSLEYEELSPEEILELQRELGA